MNRKGVQENIGGNKEHGGARGACCLREWERCANLYFGRGSHTFKSWKG